MSAFNNNIEYNNSSDSTGDSSSEEELYNSSTRIDVAFKNSGLAIVIEETNKILTEIANHKSCIR